MFSDFTILLKSTNFPSFLFQPVVRGGADNSFVRPGRKRATANKLGIYSTYSPRSSIQFLARCSNFCKPLKRKKFSECCPSKQTPRQQWPPLRTKDGDLSIVFQSREQVVVWRGQIRRKWWVIKTLEAQVGQFLLGCRCPVSRGIVVQEQDPLCEIPATYFLRNILQVHQQRWVILRVDSLALWKIINEEVAILIPKKSRREIFQRVFAFGNFGTGWAAMPPLHLLLLCLRVIVI